MKSRLTKSLTSLTDGEDEDLFSNSLFNFYREKDLTSGKNDSLHRITIASKLAHNKSLNNRKSVADFCVKFIYNFVESNKVTGLILLYPNHVLHIIESTESTILEVVKCFLRMETGNTLEDEEIMFSRSRILTVSQNLSQRLYTQYSTKILDMEAANVNLFETADPDHKTVMDVMLQLTKLGAFLYKEPLKDQKEFVPEIFAMKLAEILEHVRDQVPELIPQQIIVGHLAEISQDSCLITPEEFVKIYETPFSTYLESDMVWPAQRNTFLFS